ncbi:aspartate kinase [Leptolinea tardivitalis]|uniref:Aspartokinase n=1 Tax=Leptolinea tardivitalis TaxID=229920 RepID=A0A0P6X831_9CHLR|nr:aspartate kinase [Leptolinea tardivitalis]KPL71329.1 aspartate kinase [Leptolinea tardivitalis]GAP23107.1 aspartate kinase [Leptolinea tardivitalis]
MEITKPNKASEILVMKFGGTSVGSPDAMRTVAEIVEHEKKYWKGVIPVVSALNGVTNLLLETAQKAAAGDRSVIDANSQELRTRHQTMIDSLLTTESEKKKLTWEVTQLINEFTNLVQAMYVLGEASPRGIDAVGSLGERMSARVLAALLNEHKVKATAVDSTQCIVTDARFMSANPDETATREKTRSTLLPLIEKGTVPVVTGFLGATPDGVVTTLGRGGSDFSAALLGAAIPAGEVWIWTDVDGVMTADPRLVPDASTISQLSYREVSELAYFGAKVLHPKTIRPVIENNIPLRVCNTFSPEKTGTWIVSDTSYLTKGIVKAVTAISDLSLVTVEGTGMLGVPGVAARTFDAVAKTGTSVPLISQASSEQSICFTVPIEAAERVKKALEKAFTGEIQRRDIDGISISPAVGIVSVVGAGMRYTPGVAGRIFTALGDAHVNVIAIAQGSSEVSISLVVSQESLKEAVRTLHGLINLEQGA